MTHSSCISTFVAGLALLFFCVVSFHAGLAAGHVATQNNELWNGSASSRVWLNSDVAKRDGKITGRIWAESGGGWRMKCPATTKITFYVCKSGKRELFKDWFTYQGKIMGGGGVEPNVSKHWLQTDTQVHVHVAHMRQTPSVVAAYPAAKWCCVITAVESSRVHSRSGTAQISSAGNKYFWEH